ncbi:MAG: hypothetical protein R3E69_15585 [Steroidobacteraceae bacterium]
MFHFNDARAAIETAAAHFGLPAIPPAWRESLASKDLIIDVADRLLVRATEALAR